MPLLPLQDAARITEKPKTKWPTLQRHSSCKPWQKERRIRANPPKSQINTLPRIPDHQRIANTDCSELSPEMHLNARSWPAILSQHMSLLPLHAAQIPRKPETKWPELQRLKFKLQSLKANSDQEEWWEQGCTSKEGRVGFSKQFENWGRTEREIVNKIREDWMRWKYLMELKYLRKLKAMVIAICAAPVALRIIWAAPDEWYLPSSIHPSSGAYISTPQIS